MSRKFKNIDWDIPVTSTGNIADWDAVRTSVLMDVRDNLVDVRNELQKLNSLLHCQNFIDIPNILRRVDVSARHIDTNTVKARRPKQVKKVKPE